MCRFGVFVDWCVGLMAVFGIVSLLEFIYNLNYLLMIRFAELIKPGSGKSSARYAMLIVTGKQIGRAHV